MNRHSLKLVILLSAIGFGLSFTQCSLPGDSNGSGTGNAVICGKLYAPDGITPAVNASVKVWDINTVSSITREKEVRNPLPVQMVRTDDDGYFSIDRIDNGMYVMEASDQSNNMARFDSVSVDPTKVNFLSDTLKVHGVITGKVVFENGVDTLGAYISCSATQSCPFPKSDSTFTFGLLAEGIYRVDFHFWGHDYEPFRMLVEVTSGKTTDLGTIRIKKKLPSVNGISIDKSPLTNYTTIRWRSVESSTFAGYNLYRRIAGDTVFGQPVNGSTLITDTSFVDSTLIEGYVYEYAISVADTSNQNGPLSRIVTTSTFHVTMDLDTFDLVKPAGNIDYTFYSLVNSKNPDFFYLKVNYREKMQNTEKYDIQKYTADGSYIGSRSFLEEYHRKVVVDENGQIYCQTNADTISKIISIDTDGNQKVVVLNEEGKLMNFDVFGNSMVLVTELPWKQTSKSGKSIYRIKRLLINDGTVVYSKDIEIDLSNYSLHHSYEMVLLDVIMDRNFTVRLFLDAQLRTFDSSGMEMPSKVLLLDQHDSYFSSSNYLINQCWGNNSNFTSSFYNVSVYDFNNRKLFGGELEASWIWFSIASNGDIYIMFGNPETHTETLCRMKNQSPAM